jgi:hypothetical protein
MSQVNINPERPADSGAGGASVVLIVALLLLILVLILAYVVLWPMLTAQPQTPSVNVNVRSEGMLEGVARLIA